MLPLTSPKQGGRYVLTWTLSAVGSSIPSGAIGTIADYFNVKGEELLVLPVSIFLIGYILGPLVFAPLSESYGRKKVMISESVGRR